MNWEQPGVVNTEATINAALKRAGELGVHHLVAASCTGASLKKIMALKPELKIVGVTHHIGFSGPGQDEMDSQTRQDLQAQGVQLLTTTHLLAGVDRAIRIEFGGLYPAEIIAASLRMFGQGVKVAVEIAVMALDAGLIPYGEDVAAVAGTARGLDTAIVVRPAHSNKFFQTEVREIICMPRLKKFVKA